MQVWDVKFPNVIIPHVNMRDEEVQRYAHSKVASAMSWSMWQSLKGIGPEFDMDNDRLTSPFQLSLKGKRLAGGWKLVYFGWKADLKARVQAHFFSNYYLCNNICDRCFATSPMANKHLAFTHLGEDAAYWMTELSHSDYARHNSDPSPWMEMPGFRLETVFFDAMHIIWLGTARVLLGSCLNVWHRLGFLGNASYGANLKAFSVDMKNTCRANKIMGRCFQYTLYRLGLVSCGTFKFRLFEAESVSQARIHHNMPAFTKNNSIQEDWAELGSMFKAMAVKNSMWYFCVKAAEFSKARPEECFCLQKFSE